MTNQQAINFLDQARKILLDDKSWLESAIQPINEAFDAAISALEKQIPKKPVIGYAFGEKIREAIKKIDPERAESKRECCPVCGRTLGMSRFVKAQTGLRVGDPHCKKCGQAIDWKDNQWAN